MNRRRFLGLTGTAALAAMAGGRFRRAWAADVAAGPPTGTHLPQAGPLVVELIHLNADRSAPAPAPAELADLLDLLLPQVIDRPDDLPLDAWATLFPEEESCGIKVFAEDPGPLTGALAAAVASRAMDADVPAEKVTLWDRREPAAALGLRFAAGRTPRVKSASVEGYGRRLRPGGAEPPAASAARAGKPAATDDSSVPRLSKLVEGIARHATVTPLRATDDGRMGPFVLESLALGATDWKGENPGGDTLARWAADPALVPRARVHLADLWSVPLGRLKGEIRRWDARTILMSTDPLALTAVAHALLAGAREGGGLGPTPPPEALSAAGRLGLGKADLRSVRWRKWSF